MFNSLNDKKQFKKEKLEELGLNEETVRKYAEKETAKMFTKVDTCALLQDLVQTYEYPDTTYIEYMKYELECLGYITYKNPNTDKHLYYVSSVDVKKMIVNVQLYEIHSGKTREVRTWTSQYSKNPFHAGNIMYITTLEKKNKKEPTGEINEATGKRIYRDVPDKFEYWLSKFVIREDEAA